MNKGLQMQERIQPSPMTAALSITAAALALFCPPTSACAGDKIEFSIPGNQAIVQKPEWQVPDDDSAPVEFKKAKVGRRYQIQDAGTTIIIPASDDRHHGLRAWDAASRLSDLGKSDDPLDRPPDSQPRNSLTNQFDSGSQWDLGAQSSRYQTSTFGGQHNSGFSTGSSEFSSQSGSGFSALHAAEDGSLSVPSFGLSGGSWHGDALVQTPAGGGGLHSAAAAGVGLTAWGADAVPSTVANLADRYSDSFQTAGNSSGNDNSLDVSGPKGLLSSSPTPGVGDNSIFGLTANARSAPWINSDGTEIPYNSHAQDFRRGVYRAYQQPTGQPLAPRLPHLPQGVLSPYAGVNPAEKVNQQFASHPPILPLPKKPGSVFE